MTRELAKTTRARSRAPWWLVLMAWSAALAGPPPPPAAPAPPPEVLIDPNAPEPPPVVARSVVAADPAKVEKGKRMYKDFCQKCHGVDMVSPGGGFFDLRTFPHDDKPRFVHSVTNGKRAMPAWGGVLKPDEIDTVWAYVSSAGSAH